MRALRTWVIGVLLATAAAPGTAVAQEPTASETALARRLFREGLRAAEAGRWTEARDAFARSYELVGRPRILVNLAAAQAQTGRLVRAAESYRRFLAQATGERDARLRRAVEEELAALEPRIPKVRIEASGLLPDDALEMDGHALARAVVGEQLPVDPGEHLLAVRRGGREVAGTHFTVGEGDERTVSIEAPPPLPPVAAEPEPLAPPEPVAAEPEPVAPPEPDSSGVFESPWLWTGVGAAVVAVVVTVLIVSGSGPERRSGNVGDGRWVIE